jgi:hypothetical protein
MLDDDISELVGDGVDDPHPHDAIHAGLVGAETSERTWPSTEYRSTVRRNTLGQRA